MVESYHVNKESQHCRSSTVKVTSFQTCLRRSKKQYKFEDKTSLPIILKKFTKLCKFEGKIDIEVPGHKFSKLA